MLVIAEEFTMTVAMKLFKQLATAILWFLTFASIGGVSTTCAIILIIVGSELAYKSHCTLPSDAIMIIPYLLFLLPLVLAAKQLWRRSRLSNGVRFRLALSLSLAAAICTNVGLILGLCMGMADSPGSDHQSGRLALELMWQYLQVESWLLLAIPVESGLSLAITQSRKSFLLSA